MQSRGLSSRLADVRVRAVLRIADDLNGPHAPAVGLRELLYPTAIQSADPTCGETLAAKEGEDRR